MEISELRRDASKVASGQWVDDIPNMGDLRLCVRGLQCAQARVLRERKERRVDRSGRDRDGTILPKVRDSILAEVMLEVILLDWDGITDNGKPVPYSKELAKEWLTNPDFVAFQDAVAWSGIVVERGNREDQESLEKNSVTPSTGNSGGENATGV